MMTFGAIWMLLFWGLVIFAVVVGVRWSAGRGPGWHAAPRQKAFDILAERYARGEIDAEEFAERKRVLSGSATRAPLVEPGPGDRDGTDR